MRQWTKEEAFKEIENSAVNGSVSRAELTRIANHFLCGPEVGAAINNALYGLTNANKHTFTLTGDLASLNQPKETWTPEQVVNQLVSKTKQVAGKGGVITRNDLLTVAFDARTPFNVRARLRGVTEGANAHKMEFSTSDFKQAFKR